MVIPSLSLQIFTSKHSQHYVDIEQFIAYTYTVAYKIEFTQKSLKAVLKLPKLVQANLMKKVQALADDPYAVNNNVKKLQGEKDCYRLRVGDYRILYHILNEKLIIEVIHIAHRREAYR